MRKFLFTILALLSVLPALHAQRGLVRHHPVALRYAIIAGIHGELIKDYDREASIDRYYGFILPESVVEIAVNPMDHYKTILDDGDHNNKVSLSIEIKTKDGSYVEPLRKDWEAPSRPPKGDLRTKLPPNAESVTLSCSYSATLYAWPFLELRSTGVTATYRVLDEPEYKIARVSGYSSPDNADSQQGCPICGAPELPYQIKYLLGSGYDIYYGCEKDPEHKLKKYSETDRKLRRIKLYLNDEIRLLKPENGETKGLPYIQFEDKADGDEYRFYGPGRLIFRPTLTLLEPNGFDSSLDEICGFGEYGGALFMRYTLDPEANKGCGYAVRAPVNTFEKDLECDCVIGIKGTIVMAALNYVRVFAGEVEVAGEHGDTVSVKAGEILKRQPGGETSLEPFDIEEAAARIGLSMEDVERHYEPGYVSHGLAVPEENVVWMDDFGDPEVAAAVLMQEYQEEASEEEESASGDGEGRAASEGSDASGGSLLWLWILLAGIGVLILLLILLLRHRKPSAPKPERAPKVKPVPKAKPAPKPAAAPKPAPKVKPERTPAAKPTPKTAAVSTVAPEAPATAEAAPKAKPTPKAAAMAKPVSTAAATAETAPKAPAVPKAAPKVAAVPKPSPKASPAAAAPAGQKFCKHCGSPLKNPAAKFCPHCGKELTPAAGVPKTGTPAAKTPVNDAGVPFLRTPAADYRALAKEEGIHYLCRRKHNHRR